MGSLSRKQTRDGRRETMMIRNYDLMGGNLELELMDSQEYASIIAQDCYHEGRRLQEIFDPHDPDSELSLLNRKRRMAVSPELIEVVKQALKLCEETDGLYDVAMGKQFHELRKGNTISRIGGSYKDIRILPGMIELRGQEAMLDLSSIAKGFIIDRLVDFLRAHGIRSGLVNADGDMRIFGREAIIEVQHPTDMKKGIFPFILQDCAVATSGEQWNADHILYPKDIVSVSVLAETLMEADAIATCIMVLGSEKAERFMRRRPHLKVLAIDYRMNSIIYNGFGGLLAEV